MILYFTFLLELHFNEYFKDYTEEEINDFMENTSGEVIKGIQQFFETVPKLRHEIKYKNKKLSIK